MALTYTKTVWADGDNRYDIKTQASAVVTADIKLIYVGTAAGTAISQTTMNNIEDGIDAIVNYIEFTKKTTEQIAFFGWQF